MKLDVFPYDSDFCLGLGIPQVLHHSRPVCKVRFRAWDMKTFTDHLSQMFFFHSQRGLIQVFHIQILEYMIGRYITEQCDLVFQLIRQPILRTAYQYIRPQTHALKFFYTGLSRLGLQLSGSFQIRYQGHVDQHCVFLSHIMLELTDGFQERLALNISCSSSHFYNRNPVFLRSFSSVKPAFDLIGNVRDDLYRAAAIIPVTFLLKHCPVNLSRSHI